MQLINQTILITGGTSGIGLELGKALLRDNKVILLGRDPAKLESATAMGFHTICCDLANPDDIENAVLRIEQHYPDLNVLFNNAGIQENYLYTETIVPARRIQREINVNLTGQLILTQQLLPLLATQDKKSLIVNTSSGLGLFPKEDGLVYSATKAAMRNFTRGLRYALKKTRVQVVEFMPPVTDTAMTRARDEAKMSPHKLVTTALSQLKRGKKLITVRSLRIFVWIAFLFPGVAHRILSK